MSTSPDIDVFGEAPEGERPRIDLAAEHKPRIWARFLAKWIDFYLCLIPSFAIMMGLIFIYGFVATLLFDCQLRSSTSYSAESSVGLR